MKERSVSMVLAVTCLVLALMIFPFRAAMADPVKLKAVTFLPDYVEGVDAFLNKRDPTFKHK